MLSNCFLQRNCGNLIIYKLISVLLCLCRFKFYLVFFFLKNVRVPFRISIKTGRMQMRWGKRSHSRTKLDTFRRNAQACVLGNGQYSWAVFLPSAAAVQCAIMNPEFRPPSATRKGGSSLREGLQSLSILLSLIAASSWTPMAK